MRNRRRSVCGVALLSIGVVVPVARAGATSAATVASFTVNSTADTADAAPGDGSCADASGLCTLRAAVEESNASPAGSSTSVVLPAGTYRLSLGPLQDTANSLTVTGAGETTSIVEAATHIRQQLVTVAVGAQAVLALVELRGGSTKSTGGGLANAGTTTLRNVLVTANKAASGGGVANAKHAMLTVVDSSITANATANGGPSRPGGAGGGILNAGTLVLTSSTVSGNTAGSGGDGTLNPAGQGGDGGGAANTGTMTVTSSTISGNGAGGGGYAPGGNEPTGPGGDGGGVYSTGSLTLTATSVTSNVGGSSGPASEKLARGGNGGGIWSSGALSITGGDVSQDAAGSGNGGGGMGGGLYTRGTAAISGTTFTSDVGGVGATAQGGSGGAIANFGTLSLGASTLSSDTAGAGQGGSPGGAGGGLYSTRAATLAGDTFSGDTSGAGGDADFADPGCLAPGPGGDGGAIATTGPLSLLNSTVTDNATGTGGAYQLPCAGRAPSGVGAAVAVLGGAFSSRYATLAQNTDGLAVVSGTATLVGTIVSGSAPNCSGVVTETSGYNLDSGTTCGFTAATDLVGVDPMLGTLAANGGPTATMALAGTSPAIDAGASCPSTDQRGLLRPDETTDLGHCDIGAFETQPAP